MNTPTHEPRRIPPLLLEQWRLGELAEDRKTALRNEFGEQRINEALTALEAEAAFLARAPAMTNVRPLIPPPKPRPLWLKVTPWLAAACALLIVMVQLQKPATDEILFKGEKKPLIAYRQAASDVLVVHEQELLKENDVLQFAYEADTFEYGVILSVDGRGAVNWIFPQNKGDDSRLVKGVRTLLKSSYKLDNAPSFERFFFIRSMKPLDPSELEQTVKRLAQEPKPTLDDPNLDLFSLSIRK